MVLVHQVSLLLEYNQKPRPLNATQTEIPLSSQLLLQQESHEILQLTQPQTTADEFDELRVSPCLKYNCIRGWM